MFTINDLTQELEEPIPAAAVTLRASWDEYWEGLGSDRASKDAIVLEIDSMRDITLKMLQKLD